MPRTAGRGGALRRLRLNAGLTVADVAREAGVSPEALRRMERDQRDVLLTVALRVARCLDVDVEDLFGPIANRR